MEILKFLENVRSPFFSAVFGFITHLGEETVAIVVLCAIFWCINKRIAYGIGVAYFLSGLTVQGMKICFRIDRPWIVDPTLNPLPSALPQATGYSFPSGHTQSAAVLFGSLGVQIKYKTIKALCFFLVLLVAFSRMYLGVHTLLDVVTSLLITLLFVFITEKILVGDPAVQRRQPRGGVLDPAPVASDCAEESGDTEQPVAVMRSAMPRERAGLTASSGNKTRELIPAFFMTLFACAIIVIAAVLYSGAKIELQYLSDCLKAAGAGVGFVSGMYIERNFIVFSVNAKNILWQIIKFIIGIAGVLVIKEGLKLIIGSGLISDTLRYFIMLIWVTVFFPLIIKQFFTAPGT